MEDNTEQKINLLRKVVTFKTFTDNELADLIDFCDFVIYDDNEVIVKEGDNRNQLFGVLKGSVIVNVSNTEKSKEVYIYTIGKGEIFGEAAIFIKTKRTANVISVGDTMLFSMDHDKFFSYIKTHSRQGIIILILLFKEVFEIPNNPCRRGVLQVEYLIVFATRRHPRKKILQGIERFGVL